MSKYLSDLEYLFSLGRKKCSSFGMCNVLNVKGISINMKSRKKKYLVFTDCGEEIDDEVALYFLYQLKDVDLTIVFVGIDKKVTDFNNVADQTKSLNAWKNFGFKPKGSATLMTLSDFKNKGSKGPYDAVIQIAPMHGYTGDDIIFNKYILLGTYNSSVNSPANRTPDMSDTAKSKGIPFVEIISTQAALMRPTKELLNKLPSKLQNEMIEVGFKLIVKRAPPSLGFAEGLINDEVGRGANYTSVKNLANVKGINIDTIIPSQDSIDKANSYASALGEPKTKQIRENTIGKLSRMYEGFKQIGMNVPVILDDNTFHAYRKSKEGASAFQAFVPAAKLEPSVLNPLYDLFGAYIGVTGNNPASESMDSFNNSILRLF
jgi:hypothetical protein